MILELTGIADGSTPWQLRYTATRAVILELVDVFDETSAAFLSIGIAAHGSPLTAAAGLKQGATAGPGLSVIWSGEVRLERDEDLVVVGTNLAANDVIKAKFKMRGV